MTTKIDFSKVEVIKVYKAEYQKEGTLTAMLQQKATKISEYPSQNVHNSIDDKIFNEKDFDTKPQTFTNEETRTFFLNVPSHMDTVEKVQEHLKQFPMLHIWKMKANKPILSKEDEITIEQGKLTMEKKAEAQVIRDEKGKLILYMNKIQYKRYCISTQFKEDVDERDSDANNIYLTEAMYKELHPEVETA